MQNYFFTSLSLLVTLFLLLSCEKERSIVGAQTTEPTKEQLYTIFTTSSDDEINSSKYNIDALIEESFSLEEREEMILERADRFLPVEGQKIIAVIFEGFKDAYGVSYLIDEPSYTAQKELFCSQLISQLSIDVENLEKGGCLWPDEGCILEPTEDCPDWAGFAGYSQDKSAFLRIRSTECAKTTGDTDCDYGYVWYPPSSVYNNTSAYNFIWYCENSLYRSLMPSSIGGYKRSSAVSPPGVYSTFLGVQHRIAMEAAFIANAPCQQDQFVDKTEFGYLAKQSRPRN